MIVNEISSTELVWLYQKPEPKIGVYQDIVDPWSSLKQMNLELCH